MSQLKPAVPVAVQGQALQPLAPVQPVVDPNAPKYKVTLVNGVTYFLGDRRFETNIPQIVTEEEAAILQDAHTSSAILDPNEGVQPLIKPRFTIEEAEEGAVITPMVASPLVRTTGTRVRVRHRPVPAAA